MSSVTNRIKQIKQPRGGYIKPSQFQKIVFNDKLTLYEENLNSSIIGMVVDYLTRFTETLNVKSAFKISILGYQLRKKILGNAIFEKDTKEGIDIASLLTQIKGLDDASIIAACKLCTYDIWYRNPLAAQTAKKTNEITPDDDTIKNIQIMVERSKLFWKKYGPITVDGFTFENGGYTSTVTTGDGDYLTANTIWDFKVSKSEPTNKHTLQLLMYWIMGQHSNKEEFKNITNLGIFNPRLNKAYILDVNNISTEIIKTVENDVICY